MGAETGMSESGVTFLRVPVGVLLRRPLVDDGAADDLVLETDRADVDTGRDWGEERKDTGSSDEEFGDTDTAMLSRAGSNKG